ASSVASAKYSGRRVRPSRGLDQADRASEPGRQRLVGAPARARARARPAVGQGDLRAIRLVEARLREQQRWLSAAREDPAGHLVANPPRPVARDTVLLDDRGVEGLALERLDRVTPELDQT